MRKRLQEQSYSPFEGRRKRRIMDERSPDNSIAIDQVAGLMFRSLRKDMDMSLDEVGAYLKASPEEIRAHESGASPLSSARLFKAGCLFGVKISAFFQPFYFPECFEEHTDDKAQVDH
jgi:DNA-binding XRE family transcriptional regulator